LRELEEETAGAHSEHAWLHAHIAYA